MEKSVRGLLVILAVLLMATSASALTINNGTTDVGGLDLLVGWSNLGNSGAAVELEWVQTLIGSTYTWNKSKYDTAEADWTSTNDPKTYAMKFDGPIFPEYYMVKVGVGNNDPQISHFLFDNKASLEWAVLSLTKSFGDTNHPVEIKNIGKFSHVGEFGGEPIPEPGTLLLLGSGLAGLAWYSRKRSSS